MENTYKTCCVTGHRPKGFPWNYSQTEQMHRGYLCSLRKHIIKLIEKYGYNYFITGCAIGADLDFADICIALRDTKYPHIFIEGAIPCDGQASKWRVADKERYARVVEKLNFVHYVSHKCSMSCYQKRNEYMVDRSDLVIAIWNGTEKGGTWNTIKYARSKNKSVNYMLLGLHSGSHAHFQKSMRKFVEIERYLGKERIWQRIHKSLEEEKNNGH